MDPYSGGEADKQSRHKFTNGNGVYSLYSWFRFVNGFIRALWLRLAGLCVCPFDHLCTCLLVYLSNLHRNVERNQWEPFPP